MKIQKVFTFGCSFSDYMWKVEKPYGHYVAEKLNVDYIHEGAGCGSNHRIFRKFFNYVRDGFINESTLVTLQFTEPSRSEIWFNSILDEDLVSHDGGISMIEKYDNGGVFKYKWDSYKWNNNVNISRIMKDKTDYCYNNNFDMELTQNIMYSIIEVCKHKNIPFIVINGNYNDDYTDYNNYSDISIVNYRDIQLEYPAFFRESSELDYSHISQEGHIELGTRILNKIKEL